MFAVVDAKQQAKGIGNTSVGLLFLKLIPAQLQPQSFYCKFFQISLKNNKTLESHNLVSKNVACFVKIRIYIFLKFSLLSFFVLDLRAKPEKGMKNLDLDPDLENVEPEKPEP